MASPLKGAEVDWSHITADGVTHLCSIPTLEYLDISWVGLPAGALLSIKKASSLHCLKLNAHNIDHKLVSALNHLPIEVLHLNQCQIEGLSSLSIPTLREIWLWDSNIRDDDLSFVQSSPLLERIELKGTHIEGVKFHPLRKLSNLRILNISQTKLHANALGCVHDLPSLVYLDLSHTPVSKWHIDLLKENRRNNKLPIIQIRESS